jgi:hypothetical protein
MMSHFLRKNFIAFLSLTGLMDLSRSRTIALTREPGVATTSTLTQHLEHVPPLGRGNSEP